MQVRCGSVDLSETSLKQQIATNTIDITITLAEGEFLDRRAVNSLLHIYKIINDSNKTKQLTGNISIDMTKCEYGFEFPVISVFVLIKTKCPSIEISIRLPDKSRKDSLDIFFFLSQLRTSAMAALRTNVFSIYQGNTGVNLTITRDNIAYYFVASKRHSPVLFIDESNYGKYFKKRFCDIWAEVFPNGLPIGEIDQKLSKSKATNIPREANERLYQALRKIIIDRVSHEIELGNLPFYDDYSAILAYFRALTHLGVVWMLFDSQSKGELHSNLDSFYKIAQSPQINIGEKLTPDEIRGKIQSCIDLIASFPLYLVVLVSSIIENSLKVSRYKGKVVIPIDQLSNAIHFSADLFYGIKELGKNVVEHASTKSGVLSFRILDKHSLMSLKPKVITDQYTESPPDTGFIDLVLIDDSSSGILQETEKKLVNLLSHFDRNDPKRTRIEKDLQALRARHEPGSPKNFTLKNFFAAEHYSLLHQDIRTAASLGLLIFSDMLKSNHGCAFISTIDNGGPVSAIVSRDKTMDLQNQNRELVSERDISAMPFGTYYNIAIPISMDRTFCRRNAAPPMFETQSAADAFQALWNSKIVQTDTCEGPMAQDRCVLLRKISGKLHTDSSPGLPDRCSSCKIRNRTILCLTIDQDPDNVDASNLFRFLAKVQIQEGFSAIIISNIDHMCIQEFMRILSLYERVTDRAWSRDQYILFSFNDSAFHNSYNFWLVGGEHTSDMADLNESLFTVTSQELINIAKHNKRSTFSLPNGSSEPGTLPNESGNLSRRSNNPLFTGAGHLLPFDVLISVDGMPVFGWNVLKRMLAEVGNRDFPGYRLKNAHVKLGSKIHIDDFIYGKRMFQNSYYAMRFGFILAQQLDVEVFYPKRDRGHSLCVLGYGTYSELMLSICVRLLQLKHKARQISHRVVSDVEINTIEGGVIPKGSEIQVVIPIASTLSTAVKIKTMLSKRYPECEIREPLNIVVVGHKSLSQLCDPVRDGEVTDETVRRYWKRVDATTLRIITTDRTAEVQRYWFYIPVGWRLPASCELCQPDQSHRVAEQPLFLTDKESTTPTLILRMPEGKHLPHTPHHHPSFSSNIHPRKVTAQISADLVCYKHVERGQNHYLYYINTQRFFEVNRNDIEKWCEEARNDLRDLISTNVVLIAPAHSTNAEFISLLNSNIFRGTATVLYYDPQENYEENLETFFIKEISKNSKIFFIDDALCSGRTFFTVSNYLKSCSLQMPPTLNPVHNIKSDSTLMITGIFSLINRLNSRANAVIQDFVDGRLYSYIHLDAPVMNKFRCPLCDDKVLYQRIQEDCTIDAIKILLGRSITTLETQAFNEIPLEKSSAVLQSCEVSVAVHRNELSGQLCSVAIPSSLAMGAGAPDRYLSRLQAQHNLYRVLTENKEEAQQIFDERSPKSFERLMELLALDYNVAEDRVCILKILTQNAFYMFYSVKKGALAWTLSEIENTFSDITKMNEQQALPDVIDKFRYMKFLLNRLAFLNSSYPLRPDVLQLFESVYEKYKKCWRNQIVEEIHRLNKPGEHSSEAKGPIEHTQYAQLTLDFQYRSALGGKLDKEQLKKFLHRMDNINLYICKIIKRVVWNDEGKCVHLERSLDGLRHHKENQSTSLRRLLRIENTNVLNAFVNWFLEFACEIDGLTYDVRTYEQDKERLLRFITEKDLTTHYRARPLLLDFYEDWHVSHEFHLELPHLLLSGSALASRSSSTDPVTASSRLKYVLHALCKLIGIKPGVDGGALCLAKCGIGQGGLVTPGQDDLYLVEVARTDSLKEDLFPNWEHSFAYRVLTGYVTSKNLPNLPGIDLPAGYPWTNVELLRNQNGDFESVTGEKELSRNIPEVKQIQNSIDLEVRSPLRYLLYIRLSNLRSFLDTQGIGVILIYSTRQSFITTKSIRNCLLHRNKISAFVDQNFNNDLYRRLVIENRELLEISDMTHGLKKIMDSFKRGIYHSNLRLTNVIIDMVLRRYDYVRILRYKSSHQDSEDITPILMDRKLMPHPIQLDIFEQDINDIKQIVGLDENRSIDLTLSINDIPPNIDIHSNILLDAVYECMVNAVKSATTETSNVRIDIYTSISINGKHELRIRDYGRGVAQEDLAFLRRFNYSGIRKGLRMFGILWVNILGSQLRFDSEPGTYFEAILPLER